MFVTFAGAFLVKVRHSPSLINSSRTLSVTSSSCPSIHSTLRWNGDKRFARSFRKLSTYSGRPGWLLMINMGRSCSRVSLPGCWQPKVLTLTRFPPSPRVPAHAQKFLRLKGKNLADGRPPHHVLVPNFRRCQLFPSLPPLRSNSYLLIVTQGDIRHPRLTLAWASTHPTLIRAPRCQWIKSF